MLKNLVIQRVISSGNFVSSSYSEEVGENFDFTPLTERNLKLLLFGTAKTILNAFQLEMKEMDWNRNIISDCYKQDLWSYSAVIDALLFPRYRKRFTNVVLQRGAMGTISIVTNINSCNEILIKCLQYEAHKKIVNLYQKKLVWQAILAEYRTAEHHV